MGLVKCEVGVYLASAQCSEVKYGVWGLKKCPKLRGAQSREVLNTKNDREKNWDRSKCQM